MLYEVITSKQRIVPLGEAATVELRRYLTEARPFLEKEPHCPRIFLNRAGKGLRNNFV